jgi:hypothetical protein
MFGMVEESFRASSNKNMASREHQELGLFEHKIGKSTHEKLVQMQMYVNNYNRGINLKYKYPTIGIILDMTKNDALVKLTMLKNVNNNASRYPSYGCTSGCPRQRSLNC